MKAPVKPGISRGYAPDKKAADRLKAAGVRVIYEGEKGQTPDVFNMRKGETLGVVDGFLAFGTTRSDIKAAIKRIHEQGATVVDIDSGMDSRAHSLELFDAALYPKPSAEHMEMMRAAKQEQRTKGRMPIRQATVIWRDARITDWKKALALMPGWTKHAAYTEIGKRNVPAGRTPNGMKS